MGKMIVEWQGRGSSSLREEERYYIICFSSWHLALKGNRRQHSDYFDLCKFPLFALCAAL